MGDIPGNDLDLGLLAGGGNRLMFPRNIRDKHLYVCGATGTGKSKFLESLIRQDIKNWHRERCGLILLDPHAGLYDSLMEWLAWNHDVLNVPIIPIDLRQDDWVIGYNLLRDRPSVDPAVLTDNIIEAMAYVWGQSGTNATPLFARWAGNVLRVLYEKKLTLLEAEHLVSHLQKQVRLALTSDLEDRPSRQDWAFASTLNPKDFEAQVGSTVNRLQRFIRNGTMRSIFGQSRASLDLGRALEDGSIILVSLATERAKVSKENAELFATLILSDLWTAAQERGKRHGIKPFYVYLDEFQRFVTPTISENLDEARGFGLHLTLAHQFPNQLLDRGESGRRVYNSIMENASNKVVFRLTHDENLRAMAQWLFMGVMDPDEVKHELYSTKVMGYAEEWRKTTSESFSRGSQFGTQKGAAQGSGAGATWNLSRDEDDVASESESDFASTSESESEAWSESSTYSSSQAPMLVPLIGKELSHVQFRSLEEQLFRAMAVLFDQKERHGVARLVGMRAPVSIQTPTVVKPPTTPERLKRFLDLCYNKLPFALPSAEAKKQVIEREETILAEVLSKASDEPVTAKRKKAK